MLGNNVELTFFQDYHPYKKYTTNQPQYPDFIMDTALVKFGAYLGDDIKVSTLVNTEAVVRISVTITQTYANL